MGRSILTFPGWCSGVLEGVDLDLDVSDIPIVDHSTNVDVPDVLQRAPRATFIIPTPYRQGVDRGNAGQLREESWCTIPKRPVGIDDDHIADPCPYIVGNPAPHQPRVLPLQPLLSLLGTGRMFRDCGSRWSRGESGLSLLMFVKRGWSLWGS